MMDWLYPQTIEKAVSKYNGEIKVTKFRGQYSVWVGGFEQSGSVYVEKLWRDALRHSGLSRISNVLILGLGCGTVVKLISKFWPAAKITGVEIDPVMIDLGKKYFALLQFPDLKIIQSHAREYIKYSKTKFDLILIDAYIGNTKSSLPTVKKLLSKNGIIVTNNLHGTQNKLLISR